MRYGRSWNCRAVLSAGCMWGKTWGAFSLYCDGLCQDGMYGVPKTSKARALAIVHTFMGCVPGGHSIWPFCFQSGRGACVCVWREGIGALY